VEASVADARGRRGTMMRMRRIIYALASLAALLMAVGAGWRPD
jgi:hypothetical protein